ncbi:helix-turn-helix domain-containing protein, partial [Bifidobacterium longum]
MGEACSRLSEEERQVIRIEIGNGTSIRRIGLMLGRNASTVGREIERDTWFPSDENGSCRPCRPKRLKTGPWTGGCYIAGPARRRAGRRRARSRRRHRLSCERLWARVAEWLRRGWSPPPVGGRPRVLFPDDPTMCVRPESVCRWIYVDRHHRERRARRLPRGSRRRRGRGGGRTSRFPIPGRAPISGRPPEAGDRSGFGHWEADGVIGAGCNPHTEVERKTRFLM